MVTWLNASFEMRFRFVGGLTVRFAASDDHSDQALLLSPWPERLLAFAPVWWRLAKRAHLGAAAPHPGRTPVRVRIRAHQRRREGNDVL